MRQGAKDQATMPSAQGQMNYGIALITDRYEPLHPDATADPGETAKA
jgi:hypothetical protein